jgi:hypothetical protein
MTFDWPSETLAFALTEKGDEWLWNIVGNNCKP